MFAQPALAPAPAPANPVRDAGLLLADLSGSCIGLQVNASGCVGRAACPRRLTRVTHECIFIFKISINNCIHIPNTWTQSYSYLKYHRGAVFIFVFVNNIHIHALRRYTQKGILHSEGPEKARKLMENHTTKGRNSDSGQG